MSVAATLFCHDCRQVAPAIGDQGAIGFPALADSPETTAGLHNFGYLDGAFAAIGYRSWELEAVGAFLNAHRGHDVALHLEGEEVAEYGSPARESLDLSNVTTFDFSGAGLVLAIYELRCAKCRASFRDGPTKLSAAKPLTLTRDQISMFLQRVRSADNTNFHRLSGILDYYGRQEEFADFLKTHARHRPVARIVQEETWQAERGTQPWRLAWSRPEPLPYNREPLVSGDRIFVIDGAAPIEKREVVPALWCLDLTGQEVWRRELAGNAYPRPELTRHGLIVHTTRSSADTRVERNVVCLDPATGDILWTRPTPFGCMAWLPGREAFVGRQAILEPAREDRIAVVELPTLEVRWQWVHVPQDYREGVDYDHAATSEDAVLVLRGRKETVAVCLDAATGAERWSSTPLGTRYGSSFLIVGNEALIQTGNSMVALHLADGSVAWTLDVPFGSWSESSGLVCGTTIKAFGAVDVAARAVRFIVYPSGFAAAPSPLPHFEIMCPRATVVGDELLMVDYWRDRLWGLEAATGRPRWMHRPSVGVKGLFPVLAGDRLIVQGPGLCCYERGST